jgi:POT family proton-dependent oligopeptide transporter
MADTDVPAPGPDEPARKLEASTHDTAFFGHPRGLSTLFFTEMWERFSWYGMRAFLYLYLIAPTSAGGMGMDEVPAGVLFGIYTSLVYLMSLPGGWIADRFLGQRKCVLYGGIGIMIGHVCLAIPTDNAFYLGLLCITFGTGLLKPNVSAMVGQLYGKDDTRRSAGFSIYYMGINIGALLAPILAGTLAQSAWWKGVIAGWGLDPNLSWHFGFGSAAVCMLAGVIQYVIGWHKLGDIGLRPTVPDDPARAARDRSILGGVLAVCIGVPLLGALLVSKDVVGIEIAGDSLSLTLMLIAVAMFIVMHKFMARDEDERKRVIAMVVLFVGCTSFFALFEQAATTMNDFADKFTDNSVAGHGFPSSWWQNVNPIWILLLTPLFSATWTRLAREKREPSSPTKFALGMAACGISFAFVMLALPTIDGGGRASPMFLLVFYFFQTVAELFISPVGMSSMSKLAPPRMAGMVMGVWFFAISIGEYLAGRASTVTVKLGNTGFFLFMTIASFVVAAGLYAASKPVTKMLGRRE